MKNNLKILGRFSQKLNPPSSNFNKIHYQNFDNKKNIVINKFNKNYFHTNFTNNLGKLSKKDSIPKIISLFKIQKKNSFSKFKNYYDNLKMKMEEKEDEWITLNEPIYFKNKKFLVIETQETYRNSVYWLKNYILMPGLIISCSLSIWLIFHKRIFLFILSSFFYFMISRMNKGIKLNNQKMIDKLYLLESGTEVEVVTFETTFITNIKQIRKLELEEGLYLSKNLDTIHKNYVPISINSQLYLIPKISSTNNGEILSAISNGKYIKIDDKVKAEDSIDIDLSEYNYDNESKDINQTVIDIDPEPLNEGKKEKLKNKI